LIAATNASLEVLPQIEHHYQQALPSVQAKDRREAEKLQLELEEAKAKTPKDIGVWKQTHSSQV
jgi:hypothetical protein